MDFVNVVNIARSNILAAQADVTDEVFNIAAGEETSLIELAQCLLGAMDSDLVPEHGPVRSVNAVARRLADISTARTKLGWTPAIGLKDGLRQLVEWWSSEQQPSGRSGGLATG